MVYSSSRWVTLSFLSLRGGLAQELLRGQVTEDLVQAHGVIDIFPVAQLAIELFHFQRAGRDLTELLAVGA